MKRIFFIIMICVYIVGCGKYQNNVEVDKTKDSKNEEYSFYLENNKDRYQKYQEQNPSLSWKDVILRVNIGLDNPYYTNTQPSSYLNTTKLLVNKYFYLQESYIPDDLIELDTHYSKGGISLVQEAADSFKQMVDEARKDNIIIRAISAYRSYQYQVNLYNNYVERDGKNDADTYSARPGFSEHQTGLCVDVDNRVSNFTDFEDTESFQWMQNNAYKFGFILRYPKEKENITGYSYESWHYRYVGKKVATAMREKGVTFDEYYMEFFNK